jgi:hypothetical protein
MSSNPSGSMAAELNDGIFLLLGLLVLGFGNGKNGCAVLFITYNF